MSIQNRDLEKALEFILNRATEADLNAVKQALRRRGDSGLDSVENLDFQKMARDTLEGYSERFGVGADVNETTRRIVTNLILEKVPEISVDELELLLDEWIGSPNQKKRGKEDKLPPDAVYSMVIQFVDYSLGRMSKEELFELKKNLPDWTARYWDIFSQDTKLLIKNFLDGKMDLNQFRLQLLKLLGIEP
ncbi:MAG: hypothetical protein OEZ34_07415 [Spirochaetia bacterium]|nr:hypothetical protein [Spirochaetia bacterium]